MRSSSWYVLPVLLIAFGVAPAAQTPPKPAAQSESSSSRQKKTTNARLGADIDAGTIANGVYRNHALALTCKIPDGWVLRTDEMNAREEADEAGADKNPHISQNQGDVGHPEPSGNRAGRVLLAAFSRPPEAKAADVNSSIVIAAEPVDAYPGLKEAAQYFGPLTEVAKSQGFTVDEDPYEIAVGSKVVVRGDFHKDVGSRVMRQSTLVFLARGYAVSITVIGGTEDEVEDLVDGTSFAAVK